MKRFLIIAAFVFAAFAQTARASTITVAGFTVKNWTAGGSTAKLRVVSNDSFFTTDGVQILRGSISSGSFYKEVVCTVSGTNVTCPSFPIDSTVDSSVPTATYSAYLFDSKGVRRAEYLVDFRVPTSLGTSIRWAQISTYNKTAPRSPLPSYPNVDQVNSLIAQQVQNVGTLPDASALVAGKAKISTAYDTTAVGDSDARVGVRIGTGAYSSLLDAIADAPFGASPLLTKITVSQNETIAAPLVVPANVVLDFKAGAKLVKSGTGTITFQGVGLDISTLALHTPIFQGFTAGQVTWTGSDYPREINVEVFDSATLNSFSEKWEKASLALAGKGATIKVSTNGNFTNQIRVRQGQTLSGSNCNLRDAPAVLTAAYPIVMENYSSIVGNGNESFRIYERAATALIDKGVGSVPRYVNYFIGLTPVTIVRTVANEYGQGFNRPARNLTVRNVGFYGDHNLTGFEDVGASVALGNARNSVVDSCRFEGVHAFHVQVGGTTSPDGLPNGLVNTRGVNVTIPTGSAVTSFPAFLVGEKVTINGVDYTVAAIPTATTMTLDAGAGAQDGVPMKTLFTAEDCKVTNNVSRYGVTQLYALTTGKRIEIAYNHVYDFQTPTTSQNAAIDLEPNAETDIIENIYIHHNIIDVVNAGQYCIGIIAQAGGMNSPIKFLRMENNNIIGGYLNGSQNVGTDVLLRGIVLSGAEYCDIKNNTVLHANQRGIDIENTSKSSISNNTVVESGGSGSAVFFAAVYDSVFADNDIQSSNRGGNQFILESEVSDRAVAVNGTQVTRGAGMALFFPYLVGKVVTVNGVTTTVASVESIYALTLAASAGTNASTEITMPPNTVSYKSNSAPVHLASDSNSTVTPLERIYLSNQKTTGNAAGATAANPSTLFTTTQISGYNAISNYDGRGLNYDGDQIIYRFAGSFGATASTNKRVIAQINGDNVFIDSGDLSASGGGWTLEIRGIALTANTQKWISTFTGGGVVKSKVLSTSIFNYESFPVSVLAAGTLSSDVTIEAAEARSVFGISRQ